MEKPTEKIINTVVDIAVDKITVNPYQPRKNFDVNQISELAQSIKEFGVIQPITVRENFIGGYEIIFGERRLRASKLAGKLTIPCIIVDAGENESAMIAMLENLQRSDLSFLEEADAIYHLMHEHRYTQEQLARKLGKSQSAIANKLRILKLSPEIKKIISDNHLTERHARALLRLSGDSLRLKALKHICNNNLNVSQTEEFIDKMLESLTEPKDKARGKIKGIIHLRMFMNSINKAVDMVKKSGVNVETTKTEREEAIEYKIVIEKNSSCIIK